MLLRPYYIVRIMYIMLNDIHIRVCILKQAIN